MTKVLIVYATDYGNTKKMAEVIASGAQSVKDNVNVYLGPSFDNLDFGPIMLFRLPAEPML